jgi:hypothetical protein
MQWGSIESNGILQKCIFLLRENRFIQRDEPLLTVRKRKILLWIACQVIDVAACVVISQTIAAIGKYFLRPPKEMLLESKEKPASIVLSPTVN